MSKPTEQCQNQLESDLIEEYAPLVVSQALLFRPTNVTSLDDYIQVGFMGLLRAIRHYNPNKNTKLSTFSTICIKRSIYKEFKKFNKERNVSIDIPDKIGVNLWEFEPPSLTDIEKKVLALRLKSHTYQEIGEQLGFTKSWASEILSSAFTKIREANCEKT